MGLKSFLASQAYKPSGWFGKKVTSRLLNKANNDIETFGLELMALQPDTAILEIGFGNGRLIENMGKVIDHGRIAGIEISPEMIALAQQRNATLLAEGKLSLHEASVAQIPFDDNSFDKVFTANTIYFWPDTKENIKEVLRVLKPGGTFYCAIRAEEEMIKVGFVKHNRQIFKNLYSQDSIKTFMVNSGFCEVDARLKVSKPYNCLIAMGSKSV